jgi:Uma2 family endonuclease
MPKPATRRATYADVLNAPPHVVAELVDGALETHPRPVPRHAVAAARLGSSLGGPFDLGSSGPGGWIFMVEPELHLGTNVVVPDLAGWRRERMPVVPEEAFITLAPDWICEILSPATEMLDRNAKRRIYGEAGVLFLWLLDPRTRLLETFQLVAGKWLLVGVAEADEPVCYVPFDAISFPLSDLFPFDAPPGLKPATEG